MKHRIKLVLFPCAAAALVVVISDPQVQSVLKTSLRLISPPAVFAASGNAGGLKGSASAFLRIGSGIHASLAQNCTLYAAASGDDTYTGTTRWAPKTLFGGNPASPGTNSAAGVAKPGDVVCLLGGRYELNQTFCPPNSSTTWITYQAFGDGDVDFVWTAGVTAAHRQPAQRRCNVLSSPARPHSVRSIACAGFCPLRCCGPVMRPYLLRSVCRDALGWLD